MANSVRKEYFRGGYGLRGSRQDGEGWSKMEDHQNGIYTAYLVCLSVRR